MKTFEERQQEARDATKARHEAIYLGRFKECEHCGVPAVKVIGGGKEMTSVCENCESKGPIHWDAP